MIPTSDVYNSLNLNSFQITYFINIMVLHYGLFKLPAVLHKVALLRLYMY